MAPSLTTKLAAVILFTIAATAGGAYWSASLLFQHLTLLTQDKKTDEALMAGRQALFQLHKLRRQTAEADVRRCITSGQTSTCALTDGRARFEELDVAPPSDAERWTGESTLVFAVGGRTWQAEMDWPKLRPKFEELSDILRTRAHLQEVAPQLGDSFRSVFGLTILGAGGLSLFGAYLFARNIRRRVISLTAYAARLATGRLEAAPPPTKGGDEVGVLAAAMETMAADLNTIKDRLVYAEKINSWQAIAKKVAHEIKNPLTPMSLVADHIDRLGRSAGTAINEGLQESARILREEIGALDRMVQEFSSFARLPAPQFGEEDLSLLVQDLVGRHPNNDQLSIAFQPAAAPCPVAVDKRMVFQILHNLINNARLACEPQPARINVTVALGRSSCEVVVHDNGPGVPEAVRHTLFDAYVTTRSTGERERGMGLGLAISRKIAEDHGGQLILRSSSAEAGSAFVLILPLKESV